MAQHDAIWCCASLLHVPLSDMHGVLSKLWAELKAGCHMYVSYKLGSGERSHDGRRFSNEDEQTMRAWLGAMPEFQRIDVRCT